MRVAEPIKVCLILAHRGLLSRMVLFESSNRCAESFYGILHGQQIEDLSAGFDQVVQAIEMPLYGWSTHPQGSLLERTSVFSFKQRGLGL